MRKDFLTFARSFLSFPSFLFLAAYRAPLRSYLIIAMRKFFRLKTLLCPFLLSAALLLSAGGCAKKSPDLYSYVSELRDNILTAELPDGEEKALLVVHTCLREQPYLDDGAAGTTERLTSFYFSVKDGSGTYVVSFPEQAGSPRESGGEMSYDDTKRQYYYSCSLDLSEAKTLPVTVKNAKTGKEYPFEANSVKTSATLSPRAILSSFETAENETLTPLKTGGDFAGEIRVRLIESDGKTYYFIGVISADKTSASYLLDGETAKILAKRQNK